MDKEGVVEYYSAIKKKKIMSFAVMWIGLEIIILSEINQAEKDKYYISLIWGNLKKLKMNLFSKQNQTNRHRKQAYSYQR